MTDSDEASEKTFSAGFEFARRLRDGDFRAFLKKNGWSSGQHIIMATDDEPVIDVIAKIFTHETGHRAFVAIPDEAQRFGFRLLILEVVPAGHDHPEPVALAQGASIGMLYASLGPVGTYVPSDWAQPLHCEKVATPA